MKKRFLLILALLEEDVMPMLWMAELRLRDGKKPAQEWWHWALYLDG
jgi:hypothetical protein